MQHTNTHIVQLCVVLNNMATVRKALSELRKKLELHKYYEWLTEAEEAQESGSLGKQAERLIDSLLTSADDDIANKIGQIVEQITAKVCSQLLQHCSPSVKSLLFLLKLSPDISQFLEKVMAAPPSVTTEEVCVCACACVCV